jgi:hypothetical protein
MAVSASKIFTKYLKHKLYRTHLKPIGSGYYISVDGDVYSNKIYKIDSKNNDKQITIDVKAHNLMLSAKRNCERARPYLEKNEYIQTYKLGDSEVSLLDAKGLTITLLEMLLDSQSIYGKVKLTDNQIGRVKNILKTMK